MARKDKQIRFAYLADVSIDEIVDAHIRYVTSPRMEPDEENSYLEQLSEGEGEKRFPEWHVEFKVVGEGDAAPRKAIIMPKYQFLLHVIITRCRAGKGVCRLDYAFFTELLGKSFGKMLHNLSLMGIIYLSDVYEIGGKSRLIELKDWNISFCDKSNNWIMSFVLHLKNLFSLQMKQLMYHHYYSLF